MSLGLPLLLSLAVQFLLWFNLAFPYNSFFENFHRNYYFAFSLAGFLAASISLMFYRILAFKRVSKKTFIVASFLQFLCLLSCAVLFVSSLTGWLVI
jgi:Na+/glutamate symporter